MNGGTRPASGLRQAGAARVPVTVTPTGAAVWDNVEIVDFVNDVSVSQGSAFQVNYYYEDLNRDATITIGLDSDANPYNGTGQTLSTSQTSFLTGNYQEMVYDTSIVTVPVGTNFVYAKISNGTHTRYYYAKGRLIVTPSIVGVTVQPSPTGKGLYINVDDTPYTDSHVFNWPNGESHNLDAPLTPTGNDGNTYTFSKWSDNFPYSSRSLTASAGATYTALYTGGSETKSVSLSPNADTSISAQNPTSNYGANNLLEIFKDTSTSGRYDALLKFNLSSIPSGSTVQTVELQLTPWNTTSADVFSLYKVTSSWAENSVTWNTRPSSAGALLGGGSANTSLVSVKSSDYPSLKTTVESWVDGPSQNYGFYLVTFAGTDGILFYSREESTASRRPKLLVTYILPPPPDSPSNLTATPLSSSRIRLNWTDNSNNETSFRIERSTDGLAFGEIDSVNAGVTSYTDSDLSACTEYYYQVRARNAGGDSGYTNVKSAKTSGCPAPVISASPASISQSVTQGQNAVSQSFDVWNSGSGTLIYNVIADQPWLSVSPSSGSSTGEHDPVQVNYAGSGLSAGVYNAVITISGNANNSPQTINVQITVIPAPVIELSGDLAFGSVQVGTTGQRTLTIANVGSAALTVSSISYPSGFSGPFSGTIAAGSSTNVTVTFAPTAAASYGGTVTVNGNAAGGTNTKSVSGAGMICSYTLSVSNAFFPASGGSGGVTVTAGSSCAWTVFSTNTWISIVAPTNSTGTGSITYSVDANGSTASRTGIVTIAGQPFTVSQAGLPVIFVDANATGVNDGSSWANALTNLQAGLGIASSNMEVWVAEGTYRPGTRRTDTFRIPQGVGLYGGFSGIETKRDSRNPRVYTTILSGDIGTQGVNTDNCYNVVVADNFDVSKHTDTVLDGFTISGGYADNSCSNCGQRVYEGGGIFIGGAAVNVKVRSCVFSDNYAQIGGGAWSAGNVGNEFVNCAFVKNSSTWGGGFWGSLTGSNLVFAANSAYMGGAMIGWPDIVNSTFTGNSATIAGAIRGSGTIANCILWSNTASQAGEIHMVGNMQVIHCDVSGGLAGVIGDPGTTVIDGGGNIDSDPHFVDADQPSGKDGVLGTLDDGLRLVFGSPCLDTGTSSNAPVTDIVGVARPQGAGIDMGAYEGAVPFVSACPDLTVILPAVGDLNGVVADNVPLSITWSNVSGPGPVIFGSPNATNTTATFSTNGVYVLRLTASDGTGSNSDDVTVTVNARPSADAGADQLITLPSAANLNGVVSDDGLPSNILTVAWSKLSGPGSVTFSSASTTNTTASFSTNGIYVLQLTASDGMATTNDAVTITVNAAPTVNAGPDKVITLPVNSLALAGTAVDDGWPSNSLSATWSKISGTGSVVFANASSTNTTATFSTNGVYVLRLTAIDGAATNSDDVTVAVNMRPSVDAGPDQVVTLPAAASLNGVVTDDGLPGGALAVAWSKFSGPGSVTFGNPNSATTTATFSSNDVYVLRLTASDGVSSKYDDVTVNANAAPQIDLPVTTNGVPVTLPLETNVFTVGATDPDGNPLSYLWDFGDGATSTNLSPSHVFSNCGPHEVTVTVSDGYAVVSNSFPVSVACPFRDPFSLKMKSNFAPGKLDSATLKAKVNDLPVGFSPANLTATLDIGGAAVPFTFDAKGRGINGTSTLKLTHKGKGTSTVWQVSATLRGDYDAEWADHGLTNATVTGHAISVPVLLLLESGPPESFYDEKALLYKATAGKSGSAK